MYIYNFFCSFFSNFIHSFYPFLYLIFSYLLHYSQTSSKQTPPDDKKFPIMGGVLLQEVPISGSLTAYTLGVVNGKSTTH